MQLDGRPVERIGSDLTASRSDLTTARPLAENKGIAFMGDTEGGAFDVPGHLARQWLQLPLNPNGRPNSDVLRPWMNGMEITRRPSGRWIIDFGWEMTEHEAALYEAPFAYLVSHVRPPAEPLRSLQRVLVASRGAAARDVASVGSGSTVYLHASSSETQALRMA
jgi:hypothetical protein